MKMMKSAESDEADEYDREIKNLVDNEFDLSLNKNIIFNSLMDDGFLVILRG